MNGTTTTVRRHAGYSELPAQVLEDALLLIETDPTVFHGAWSVEGGYAFSSIDAYGGDPCWLNVVGSVDAADVLVETALQDLRDRGVECYGITVPRGLDITKWAGDAEPSQWDLMSCETPPPAQAAEERVVTADDLAAVQAFLDRVNPHHSVRADHPEVERWLGAADEGSGELLAVGAFTRRPQGTGYLASIATAPESRGLGLGAAVSAALTRLAFESGDKVCTLAHFHPNEPARRIYQRIGYRTTHQGQSHAFARTSTEVV